MEEDEIRTEKSGMNYRAVVLFLSIITAFAILYVLQEKDSIFNVANRLPLNVGAPAPDFAFPGLDGKMVKLTDYRGKVVFINIWATWCPPCVEEMPSMQKLYKELEGKGFEILAVSIDSLGLKVVAPFVKKYKLTFPALLDPEGSIQDLYRTSGIPESFIIDKKGIIAKKVIGPLDWTRPEIKQIFQDLIQRPLTAG